MVAQVRPVPPPPTEICVGIDPRGFVMLGMRVKEKDLVGYLSPEQARETGRFLIGVADLIEARKSR